MDYLLIPIVLGAIFVMVLLPGYFWSRLVFHRSNLFRSLGGKFVLSLALGVSVLSITTTSLALTLGFTFRPQEVLPLSVLLILIPVGLILASERELRLSVWQKLRSSLGRFGLPPSE